MPLNYKKSSVLASVILGSLCYLPLKIIGLFFIRQRNSSIKRVLIQDGYRLGDIIMMSRIFSGLRSKYEDAEIHFISSPEACDLLRNSQWVDKLIPYRAPWCFKSGFFHSIALFIRMAVELGKARYDIAIDFQGDPRGCALLYASRISKSFSTKGFGASAFCSKTWNVPSNIQHQLLRYEFLFQKVTGIILPELATPLWPPQGNTHITKQCLKKMILIHPGASSAKRRWRTENVSILINECINKNFHVKLIGGPGDKALLETISALSQNKCTFLIPTFSELESLLSEVDCIVCNDSFMSHAAWSSNKKSVILFGSGNPHQVAPFTGANTIIWNNQILPLPFNEWTGPVCINKTSPSTVLAAVQKHLEGHNC